MKKLYTLLLTILTLSVAAQGNVGIGTNSPDASAKLDITASNMGLLVPRVSLSNVTTWGLASGTGTNGMLVYNTNASVTGGAGTGFYYWDAPKWTKVVAGTTATLPNGQIWIGDASNNPIPQTISGDAIISNTGVLDLTNLAVETSEIANNAVDGTKIHIPGNIYGSMMYFNGTDWVNLSPGTSGQLLQSNSIGTPTWTTPSDVIIAQNGLTKTPPNIIELGGIIYKNTDISGLSSTSKMTFTGDGIDVFKVDGTTFSVDATNNRVGIVNPTPTQELDVNGNILNRGILYQYASSGYGNNDGSHGISWYNPSYYSWFDYMSQPGLYFAPSHGIAPNDVTSGVTSWSRRFNIEDNSTYGWIFESGQNSLNSSPTTKFAINAGTGTFHATGNGFIDGIAKASSFAQNSNGLRIFAPDGASQVSLLNSVTGAIKITLPQYRTSTMMRMTIKIYNYADNKSYTINLGGYNYGSGTWLSTFADVTTSEGVKLNVRFGHDGTKDCIWIGETSSTWSFPQVFVTDFEAGGLNYEYHKWATGWNINFVTTLGTVESTPNVLQINNYSNVPIGSIIGWHKNMTGTPSLPLGWVECNGQTLSDLASTYHGQVIPNLNSNADSPFEAGTNNGGRYLRGSTSSGTLQSDQVPHFEINQSSTDSGIENGSVYADGTGTSYSGWLNQFYQDDRIRIRYTESQQVRPLSMTVVWIMRVK